MSESAEILFINEAFYHAFRARDLDAMDELWARQGPVICIHPGWQALTSREAIMESWRGILSNPDAPQVLCRAPQALTLGGLATVVCYEIIGGNVLVATNAFLREGGVWKMAHHQAGACNMPPEQLGAEEPPQSLQ